MSFGWFVLKMCITSFPRKFLPQDHSSRSQSDISCRGLTPAWRMIAFWYASMSWCGSSALKKTFSDFSQDFVGWKKSMHQLGFYMNIYIYIRFARDSHHNEHSIVLSHGKNWHVCCMFLDVETWPNPAGNDHISPFSNDTFESMLFLFPSWDMLKLNHSLCHQSSTWCLDVGCWTWSSTQSLPNQALKFV